MTLLVRISAIILALSSEPTLAESLSFDTSGGDAWLFEMPVAGNAGSSRCDRIVIQSPSRQARAMRIEDRFYPAPIETTQARRLETHTGVGGEEIQLRAPTVDGEYQIRLRAAQMKAVRSSAC